MAWQVVQLVAGGAAFVAALAWVEATLSPALFSAVTM
jgi:hypothetical protein